MTRVGETVGPRVHDCVVTIKHATAGAFVFSHTGQGWRLGLIVHPIFDRWLIPGGHIEADESPEQAVVREVREESGLTVRLLPAPAAITPPGLPRTVVAPPWWILEQPVPGDSGLTQPHLHVDHIYVAIADTTTPVGEAAHPFRWHAENDLDDLPMFDDTRALAALLFRHIAVLHPGPHLAANLRGQLGGVAG